MRQSSTNGEQNEPNSADPSLVILNKVRPNANDIQQLHKNHTSSIVSRQSN